MGPLYKSSMRTPTKAWSFFLRGVLWEEIVGYHFAKKKNAALICTQKDQAQIYKVEDD